MTEFDSDLLDTFVREIDNRTGIAVRPRDRDILAGKLYGRVQSLGHARIRDYAQWLFAEPDELDQRHTKRGHEWQAIVQCVSITESYLFRDRGQFQLLRGSILPAAIERRRQQTIASNGAPRLRLWSAACATGEEPYSLAILVRELLEDLDDWDVRIIATDINEAALERARRAIYSNWSFRQVDPEIRSRYFHRRSAVSGPVWQIDADISRLVSFHPLNLARSQYPDPALHLADLDLILCRNVFIYLNEATIQHVLARMARALSPDGYLLTAHAELQHQDVSAFRAYLCPQSVVYQPIAGSKTPPDTLSPHLAKLPELKTEHRQPASPPASPLPPTQRYKSTTTPTTPPVSSLPRSSHAPQRPAPHHATPTSPPPSGPTSKPVPTHNITDRLAHRDGADPVKHDVRDIQVLLNTAIARFRGKAYAKTITILDRLLEISPRHFEACDLLARTYANFGHYHQASYYCSKALEIEPCAISPYYLMAQVAENSGNVSRAKTLLKRILYLDPSATLAYLELAALYAAEGDTARSKKMEHTARNLLATRDASELLDPYRQLSVGMLRDQLQMSVSTRLRDRGWQK